MERKDSGNTQARIAWGGDNYIISDGLSTDYYINLQKEKVAQEKKGAGFARFCSFLESQEIANSSDLYRSLDDIIREKKAQHVAFFIRISFLEGTAKSYVPTQEC